MNQNKNIAKEEIYKKYLEMGFKLIPAPYKSKGALIKDWNNTAYSKYEQIEEILKSQPFINIGILTGEKVNLLVIDIDIIQNAQGTPSLEVSMNSYNKLQTLYGALPDTLTAQSGSGGIHKYFYIPSGTQIKSNANFFGKDFPGIDIKCNGGKIMAPPSIHECGNPYQWFKGFGPDEIKIAPLPPNWCNAMTEISNNSIHNLPISLSSQKITEGNRNDTLYKIACSLSSQIKDEGMLLTTMKQLNQTMCVVPLPIEELERTIKSACSHKKIPPKKIEVFSAEELYTTTLPDIQWIIPNFLGEGLNILAGNPKTGKSWFALNLAAAVSSGTSFLGMQIPKALKVLYLALEDSKYRLKSRLQMIDSILLNRNNLIMSLDLGEMKNGGLENLEKIIIENDLKLVIIDTWFKFRGIVHMGANVNAYEKDYCTLSEIKKLADKLHVSILLVHHLKKGKENNIYLEMSGSAGFAGASDSMYILENYDQSTKKLTFTGRDIIEDEMYINLGQNCIYTYTNTSPEPTPFDILSPEKREIAQIFKDSGKEHNCKEIASMIHKAEGTVRQHLSQLCKLGFLQKIKTGIYKYNLDNFYEELYTPDK